jgi:hypothetical protein
VTQNESAFLQLIHCDPETKQVPGLDMVVEYGPNKAQLRIDPAQPLGVDTPAPATLAILLQELGTALLRISEKPSTIYSHSPRHRR